MKLVYIDYTESDLIQLCRKWQVKKLSLFGSAVRDDFHADSDVDVAIEFDPKSEWDLWEFYKVREELKQLFGRQVDLIELEGVINPIRKRNILKSLEVVYESD